MDRSLRPGCHKYCSTTKAKKYRKKVLRKKSYKFHSLSFKEKTSKEKECSNQLLKAIKNLFSKKCGMFFLPFYIFY